MLGYKVQNTMSGAKYYVSMESRSPDNGVKVELYDNVHSVPKYTVLIHSSLEFTVAVYNRPIQETIPCTKELKRHCTTPYLDS